MRNLKQLLLLIYLIFFSINIQAETIVLKNGDQLKGKVISSSEEELLFQHPSLGKLTISQSQIAEIKSDDKIQEVSMVKEAIKPEEKTDTGFFNTGWLTNWKRELSIGISGSAGKAETSKAMIDFIANYEDTEARWSHKTIYYRNESDGDLSDHSLAASLNRDWLLPNSPQFYFLGGQFDLDEFKDWDERIGVNAGIGYEFIETDDFRLLGRLGLGVTKTFGGTREETNLETLIGMQIDWKLNSDQTLSLTNTLYPNLTDTGEFRNLTSLDWKMSLNKEKKYGLKLGLANEYDSLSETDEKNDFKYTFSFLMGI